MRERLLPIFQETYQELRPRVPVPDLQVEFFAYANINNTIRLREGKLWVRVCDATELRSSERIFRRYAAHARRDTRPRPCLRLRASALALRAAVAKLLRRSAAGTHLDFPSANPN